jgi:hypothetical protein
MILYITRVSNVELPCKYIIFCTLFSYVFKLTLSEYQMKQLHFIHMPKCMKLNHRFSCQMHVCTRVRHRNSSSHGVYLIKIITWKFCAAFILVFKTQWLINPTVLELEFWVDKCIFYPSAGLELTHLMHYKHKSLNLMYNTLGHTHYIIT